MKKTEWAANKTISFVGDVEMDAWLTRYADATNRSRSGLLRSIIYEFREQLAKEKELTNGFAQNN